MQNQSDINYGRTAAEAGLQLEATTASPPEDESALMPPRGFGSNIRIPLIIVVTVTALFIEFGNLLTLISALLYRRLRRQKYIPVISLAVADSLVGLNAVLFVFQRASRLMWGDYVFQVTFPSLAMASITASAWHLPVLALDRFLAITRPIQYRRTMTRRRLITLTSLCWVLAVITSALYLIWIPLNPFRKSSVAHIASMTATASNVTPTTTSSSLFCQYAVIDDHVIPIAFDFGMQFCGYVMSLGCLATLSVAVLTVTRRRKRPHLHRSDTGSGGNGDRRHVTLTARAYKMVTVVIAVYIVAYSPFFAVQIVRLVAKSKSQHRPDQVRRAAAQAAAFGFDSCDSPTETGLQLAYLLAAEMGSLVNSGVNFIIYAWLNRDFKNAYVAVLHCRCCRHEQSLGYPDRRHRRINSF